MDIGVITGVLVVCVAVVAITVAQQVRTSTSGTCNTLTLHLTRTPSGVYTALIDVGTSHGGFSAIPCVVDTGSRHLCVGGGADVGGTRRAGPGQIHYGTQVDDVSWREVAVRIGGTVRTTTVAVADRRRCMSPTCFDVFGLAIGATVASFPPTPRPFTTQFMIHPRFSLTLHALGQRGGSLVFNPPTTPHARLFKTIPGGYAWYVVKLTAILHRRRGAVVPIHGCHGPEKLMVDSGSNMLGVPPGVADGLRTTLSSGGDLVLRLVDIHGRDFDYIVPESTYRHMDGTLLLDDHARHDMVVLGSLFMVGRTFVFDDESVGIVDN